MFFDDARKAINAAVYHAPHCVGYKQGKGWTVYCPKTGAPDGVVPEFFVAAPGAMPVPLSSAALDVWISIIREALQTKH